MSFPRPEISLCTLAAINWGKIKTPADFAKPAELIVRALDQLLDYQDYPIIAAEQSTMNRRPLGVGIINFAYWMAKHDMTYTDPNLDMIDEWAEAWSYSLIQASQKLASEKGSCKKNYETKYSLGKCPVHTYKKDVDELTSRKPSLDWDGLSTDLRETGIRNSTLMADERAYRLADTVSTRRGSKGGERQSVLNQSVSNQSSVSWPSSAAARQHRSSTAFAPGHAGGPRGTEC